MSEGNTSGGGADGRRAGDGGWRSASAGAGGGGGVIVRAERAAAGVDERMRVVMHEVGGLVDGCARWVRLAMEAAGRGELGRAEAERVVAMLGTVLRGMDRLGEVVRVGVEAEGGGWRGGWPRAAGLYASEGVHRIVAGVAEHLGPMALERGVRLETRVSAGVLEAGPLPLYGVVSNAVRNAIEASPEGGLVMVSALVAGGDDGRVLVVEVRDGGAGLSEGALARAFEAGWSGKEGGVGVGLSMSREVVEGLGGRIWLERDGSAGETVLRVEVPLDREPSGRCGGGGADGRLIG